jgi:lysozyme
MTPPPNKPQLPRLGAQQLLTAAGVTAKVAIVGRRGYFASMGKPGVNDRGLYDDAIFVLTPAKYAAYNANVDPSVYRPGRGTGDAKGIASLKPGLWNFTVGLHRGQYIALRQHGRFTVIRDGIGHDYEDTGDGFGINIHRGGHDGTSSLGCQTIVPEQWASFIQLVTSELAKYGQKVVPYLLVAD